ncbi:MAG: hypothetical protein WA842_10795 [Croceibacterium sp.]
MKSQNILAAAMLLAAAPVAAQQATPAATSPVPSCRPTGMFAPPPAWKSV